LRKKWSVVKGESVCVARRRKGRERMEGVEIMWWEKGEGGEMAREREGEEGRKGKETYRRWRGRGRTWWGSRRWRRWQCPWEVEEEMSVSSAGKGEVRRRVDAPGVVEEHLPSVEAEIESRVSTSRRWKMWEENAQEDDADEGESIVSEDSSAPRTVGKDGAVDALSLETGAEADVGVCEEKSQSLAESRERTGDKEDEQQMQAQVMRPQTEVMLANHPKTSPAEAEPMDMKERRAKRQATITWKWMIVSTKPMKDVWNKVLTQ
jgi:hypothetical protein